MKNGPSNLLGLFAAESPQELVIASMAISEALWRICVILKIDAMQAWVSFIMVLENDGVTDEIAFHINR